MTQLLRQSSTASIKLGPFVDKDDGVTEMTAISLTYVQLAKNGAAFATRGSTVAASHDADGEYDIPLSATDTGTLGRLKVKAYDPATHLPVWDTYHVVPAEVYDTVILGTDNLTVDLSTGAADTVNTQVSDVLKTDPIAELSTDPGTTPTFEDALMLMYMALRNKNTASGSLRTIANNAGATVLTATIVDSGSIFTKNKFTT